MLANQRQDRAVQDQTFLPLLLITGLAFAVPLITSRVRGIALPIVVGEIAAGIVIGRSGFGLVEHSATLDFLKQFGFAFLMFLSGLEIDFRVLTSGSDGPGANSQWRRPLPLAILLFVGTLAMGVFSGWLLGEMQVVGNPLLMGLILSTTSLGVVVPVLKEQDLLRGRFGQMLLIEASIADFATLVLLTVAIALSMPGPTLDLLLIPVLLVIFLVAMHVARRFAARGVVERLMRGLYHATAQIRVRAALAFMVGWVVLAQALGVELILGAFLAGTIAGLITETSESSPREKLDAIGYGFFIPVFFIMVGVDFNLAALFNSPSALVLVGVLLLLSFAVKIIPALLLKTLFSWRETLAAGILLSSRLSLIIAAASIAVQLGVISDAVNSAIILLAVVSTTASPMLFSRVHRRSTAEERRGVILVGSDQLAEFLARRLSRYDEWVAILSPERSRLDELGRNGLRVQVGDPTRAEVLEALGAAQARALIDLTHTAEETQAVCRLARHTFGIPLVISRISDVDMVSQLQSLGVKVVQPALATAMALEGALRYPTVFDVLEHRAEEVEVGEVILGNGSLAGRPVREVRLPGNALIVSLEREQTIMVPHGDTVLRPGDRIDLIGSRDSITQAAALLRG